MKRLFVIVALAGVLFSCSNTSKNEVSAPASADKENVENQDKEVKEKAKTVKSKVYYNDRFGFQLRYPANFVIYQESDNGDGIAARTTDGSMKLTASAGFNLYKDEGMGVYEIMEQYKGWLIDDGCTITYQFAKGKVIVLSGKTRGGLIFYEKSVLYSDDDLIATVYYEYPESMREDGDAAIALIGSFPN